MQRENNWLFTKEEIENSPSRNFMSHSKENDTRRIACKFIQHVARAPRINLSRSAITTAQVLLHRYYMRKSFSDNNPWDVSIGAIFLASKLVSEYSSRISRYLIHECARVAKKIHDPKYELNPNEKEYGYWRNNMNYYEMEILRIVCYDLTFEEPYSYCATYCEKINASKEVKAVSCYLIDESFIRTTLCLEYSAKSIAAGSLLLSLFQDKMSESLKHETLKLFRENNIPIRDVKAIANTLKSMIIKMDESVSPAHSNEIKNNTHASNGYSKMYSPPARTYIKSPLSQEVADNFKQPNTIGSSNNVYSSPMASPVSQKELSIGDHTNNNESYINSSSNDYISNSYNKSLKYNSKGYMYNKYQGRPNKDKFRPKKQDKLRQKNLYYNNSNRITKYHISPTYTKINTNSNPSSNKIYL
ncbi:hypothetical protein PIROE2DRAFT_8298 [Piromyces sp. E2]|nr:hypothetical protein PIROE2DRAFT_8298 [Piromyces sp. E2]|eukprot:OUM64836.1 hypothetical protein PIROE2DRAFT_8298 [Piromyces sp. E2]